MKEKGNKRRKEKVSLMLYVYDNIFVNLIFDLLSLDEKSQIFMTFLFLRGSLEKCLNWIGGFISEYKIRQLIIICFTGSNFVTVCGFTSENLPDKF